MPFRRLVFTALSFVLGVASLRAASYTGDRPNMILIIGDDQAWDDSSVYGHPHLKLPSQERLAREGMRFDRGFVTSSSCSPSRSSIITGRYPHHTGAEQLHWPIPEGTLTFVELLQKSGYWTAAAGKWHLGEAVKKHFDVVKEADVSGFQLPTGAAEAQGKFIQQMQGDARSGCDQWVPTLKARPKDKPFFLWLGALDPHRPYDENIREHPFKPEDIVIPPYVIDHPSVRKDLALYYDEIARLDDYIGRVMDELDRQGIADNTLILYLSDNGRPFVRDKTTLYDSGIRTPWLMKWPRGIKPGTSTMSVVSAVDIAPTFLELAGFRPSPLWEGKSFARLFKNPKVKIRQYAYAEKHWHDYEDQARAVRSEQFKYIRNFYPDLPLTPSADGVRSPMYREMIKLRDAGQLKPHQKRTFVTPRPEEELYDCNADPHELKNLATDPKYASVLKSMRSALSDWQKEFDDYIPKIRTLDEFDRETGLATPARIRPRPSKADMLKGVLKGRPR
ncbi:MAG: heparan N-sulfatase [Verrucomicrobiales bacterium]|nr:heparan N-sulfatase [Verrucomicrobiales bacterium]